MAGPMSDVKVVELGLWVAGPAAGGMLADWGADVVKIEPPGVGDPARLFESMLGGLPANPVFEMDNRGKRSIVLDLSNEEGRAIGLKLIDGADVFLTNVRMSALEDLGLDPKRLLARNPRLVYGAISGFGLEGADRDRAAFDGLAYWARSGLIHMLTAPGQDVPLIPRSGIGDHITGMALAGAVAAALYSRAQTGRGQVVSTSLLRQGVYTLAFDFSMLLRLGGPLQTASRASMTNPTATCYRDRDGRWFWVIGLEPGRHWPPLCRAIGHPEWAEDARFATREARALNGKELLRLLDEVFAMKPLAEWGRLFDREDDLWWAPVQTPDEVVADPQASAAGCWVGVPDEGTTHLMPATPVDFSGTPWGPVGSAPAPGQHTDEILRELGRTREQIEALRERAAVG